MNKILYCCLCLDITFVACGLLLIVKFSIFDTTVAELSKVIIITSKVKMLINKYLIS